MSYWRLKNITSTVSAIHYSGFDLGETDQDKYTDDKLDQKVSMKPSFYILSHLAFFISYSLPTSIPIVRTGITQCPFANELNLRTFVVLPAVDEPLDDGYHYDDEEDDDAVICETLGKRGEFDAREGWEGLVEC